MPAKPSYRNLRARYEIDRCEPQTRAIRSGAFDFHALTKGHYPGTQIPKSILPGLNSIGFWNAAEKPDWGLEAHRNEGVEIMFLETGATDFGVDARQFKLRAGQFTITRPWQLHKLGAPNIGPGRLHWLILDVGVRRPHQPWRWPNWVVLAPEDIAELTTKLRHNENPVWHSTPAIAQAFRELAKGVAAWGQPHSISRLTTNLNQLFIGILDALTAQQRTGNDRQLTSHQRTVEFFFGDLEAGRVDSGAPWTLDKMAAHCQMGVTTFAKYCRELANAGPVEFLNRCRQEKAARLLREKPELTVTQIALLSGYNSSQYFATSFAKRFKRSPSSYRANPPSSLRTADCDGADVHVHERSK